MCYITETNSIMFNGEIIYLLKKKVLLIIQEVFFTK